MQRSGFAALLLAAMYGCSGPTFTSLGNDIAVPTESVERYAAEHGISRQEARSRMLSEYRAQRAEELAERYGSALDEARDAESAGDDDAQSAGEDDSPE